MSQALYRKYRPTKLTDVVGQEQITTVLNNALKEGKISHAYLFIGPRGTGKTSVARIFAHAVNGFDYQIEDHYLDIIEIDAASNTGVDNIRELREKAMIAPTKGKYKVYIIDEVHMLTKSASNALLKTLEEPPEHVIFIMATTDAHKVPITISSRTQVHTFKLAAPEVMQAHLRKIADAEKIKITDEALKIVVRRGGGSFRDSLSLLDQIASLSDQEITANLLNSALGLPQEQSIQELLRAYLGQDSTKIRQILQDLLNTGIKPEILASECIETILHDDRGQLIPLLAKLPEIQPPFPEAKLLLAFLSPSQSLSAPTAIPPQSVKTAPQTLSQEPTPAPKTAKAVKIAEKPEYQPTPPSEAVETPVAPKNSEKPANTTIATDFNWDNLLSTIHDINTAIYNQLLKVEHNFDGSTLHIYPTLSFTKKILEKPGNHQILATQLPGIALVIHDIDESQTPEDSTISQISAIMGGVKEVKGDLPF